jgi:vacuolar-type H+-ATPase subunit D/Vma8
MHYKLEKPTPLRLKVSTRHKLDLLQEQLEELTHREGVLKELLEEQQQKIDQFTEIVSQAQSNRRDLEATFQQQLESLEEQLTPQTRDQMRHMDTLLEQQIVAAQE